MLLYFWLNHSNKKFPITLKVSVRILCTGKYTGCSTQDKATIISLILKTVEFTKKCLPCSKSIIIIIFVHDRQTFIHSSICRLNFKRLIENLFFDYFEFYR